MSFLAPVRLLLLLLLLALLVAYVLLQARRTRYAVRFTNLALLDRVAPRRPGWRRHVPALFFLLMLASSMLAFARPTAEVDVPQERATVLLVIDVSVSMEATDVAPSRLEAAREAAKRFVEDLPPRFNVSLTTFAGTAGQVVAPTTDRAALIRGLDTMQLGPRTAIGEGVYVALDGLRAFAATTTSPGISDTLPPATAEVPAHMVLLSDGSNTVGRSPILAAQASATAKVPISTIAYGTPTGSVVVDGQVVNVPADSNTLRTMARLTSGSFYEAASGEELDEVYADIGTSVGTRKEAQEVGIWFVGGSLLAGVAAGLTSLLWFSRLP